MGNEEYLSQEKFNELTAELEQLKHVGRREVAEHLDYAKSLGDLSENAEYHEARDKQAEIEDRIATIESILKRAVIIGGSSRSNGHSRTIGVGSIVTVEKKGSQADTFTIVGSEEANTLEKKISHHSPLGASLIGLKKGETVTVNTPKGEIYYKIIDVK